MKQTKSLLYFSLVIIQCISVNCLAGVLKSENHYIANPIYCSINLIDLGSTKRVEVAFEISRLSNSNTPDQVEINYLIESQGKVVLEKKIDLGETSVEKINSTFYFNFSIDKDNQPGSVLKIIIRDMKTNDVIEKQAILSEAKTANSVSFGLKNLSNKNHNTYVMEGDSISFPDLNGDFPIYITRFDYEFLPAAPPMGNGIGSGARELRVDSMIVVKSNQPFTLDKKTLYFAQSDSSSTIGIGFIVVDKDYPKFSNVEKIAKSMIYISTDKEIQSFLTARDKKSVLDNFWINSGGSVENAKRLIKTYYQRVAYANKNFTTYKEGWKTDKGMIYIVFGRPDETYEVENGERWVYFLGKKRDRVTFEFFKRNNIFSGNHYELNRSPQYKKVYFTQVSKWRKGELEYE
ncbi:GWxTD domain-containing protein [Flexithrix dorotheae]|uniref:GWxTD domain-containing protein n=1 Tax=Flexithrix dorotheae TaxID=70993 RepID=UPI000381DEAF|nr:GWxTD domain-containing protein [Flexithrix dorotheae]